MIQKECPVDFIHVNENQVRLNALWVLILVSLSLFVIPMPIFIFLTIDFTLRAFSLGRYSLLSKLSSITIKSLNISFKGIDQAPKRFAAKIGILLSFTIATALFFGFGKLALSLSLVFAAFAFLESFLGFCAGCYVYMFLLKLKIIRQ
jgi:hypothetical protein